jgi:hypothetical protein
MRHRVGANEEVHMNRNRTIFAFGVVAIATVAIAAVLAGLPSTASGASGGSRQAERHGWPASSARSAHAIAHAAHASVARNGGTVFTVLEIENRTAMVDVGDAGESPGDYFLFESRLLTPDRSATVGRDSGKCMLGVTTFVCDATASIFHKGKLQVAGAFFSDADARIPIVGGTGAYRDAGGTLTIKELPSGNTLLTFEITH